MEKDENMEINKKINKIILNNKEMLLDIKLLNNMNDLNARLLEVFKLIDKYGNNPKLIIQLIINMSSLHEKDELYQQIDIEKIEKIFKSSLAVSDDSELVLEYYYFLFTIGKKDLMPKLLKDKISLILSDIDELKKHNSNENLL